MTERTTQRTVIFLHPFSLQSVDEPISAGTYVVETTEETIEGISFVGYRRISTVITIASKAYGASARQMIEIDPLELDLALAHDKEKQTMLELEAANPVAAGVQH